MDELYLQVFNFISATFVLVILSLGRFAPKILRMEAITMAWALLLIILILTEVSSASYLYKLYIGA